MSKSLFLATALVMMSLPAACGDSGGDASGADASTPKCTSNADCGNLTPGPCQTATCNTSSKTCELTPVTDGTACSTGNQCLEGESCNGGTCGGGSAVAARCNNRECGSDACGNSCGDCESNETCGDAGVCEASADGCGDVTFEGCCTAAGAVRWCQDGVIEEFDCPNDGPDNDVGPACGWVNAGDGDYYFCNAFEDPDPSATFPYLCGGEDCGSDPCGDKQCGTACGVDCGECSGDDFCNDEGMCEPNACGDLTFIGCCDSDLAVYCSGNEVIVDDCVGDGLGGCGWDADNEWYWCDGSGTDPSDANPADCRSFTYPEPVSDPGPEIGPEPEPEAMPDVQAEPTVEEDADVVEDEADVAEAADDTAETSD